jgi:SpoVK/Ycf46/Vps4 family AAA+-type ATPase
MFSVSPDEKVIRSIVEEVKWDVDAENDDGNEIIINKDEIIETMVNLSLFYTLKGVEPLGGILLFGPPGSGKTYALEAISMKLNEIVYSKHIKGHDINKDSIEQAQLNLTGAFEDSIKKTPSILFIHDIDIISGTPRLNKTLIVLMEKVKGIPQLLVIGSTNQISNMDSCLLKFGLFDRLVEFKFFTKKEQSILRSQQRLHECRRTNLNSQDDDLSLVLGCCGVLFIVSLLGSFMFVFAKK